VSIGDVKRRVLVLDCQRQRYRLRTLQPDDLGDGREAWPNNAATFLLGGEELCHYLLREDPGALVIARGPLPFLPGNKTTVGYISPLTGVPHYSFVGGRGFAELLNLGLDAIMFSGEEAPQALEHYIVISGRAPHLTVIWKPRFREVSDRSGLPTGQRSAFYWLLAHELDGGLDGEPVTGSIFTIGEAARRGYRSANLAVDGIYHAGRGGAGHVFARFTAALVLQGEPMTLDDWLGPRADAFRELRTYELRDQLARYCDRLSRRDGGTVTKLYATGQGENPTLPARNAQRLGYALADLGARKVLKASRVGQTGCHWCQVNCRHWHWVDVDYAPSGQDRYLDDFEPTYALFAMLDIQPQSGSLKARLQLLDEVDRRIVVPIEQMGLDVIDMGVALAALFEGLEENLIPAEDIPPFLRNPDTYLGDLDLAAQTVTALRKETAFPALRALGDGPQALAARYPALAERVFTCGEGTLGNAGHCNALWTFLMPFSRFFSHYSGQIYKVPGELTPALNDAEVQALFERVIAQMLQREHIGCLGNALSTCAFTFVIFSEEGEGVALDEGDLLVRTLATYGIEVRREDLEWFAEAFWAQSIVSKMAHGWHPPSAADFPARVFEALAQTLDFSPDELRGLMDQLVAEWKRQAGALLYKYGYDVDF
jgi:aldehyde:ferredoxin oxidoreductase